MVVSLKVTSTRRPSSLTYRIRAFGGREAGPRLGGVCVDGGPDGDGEHICWRLAECDIQERSQSQKTELTVIIPLSAMRISKSSVNESSDSKYITDPEIRKKCGTDFPSLPSASVVYTV